MASVEDLLATPAEPVVCITKIHPSVFELLNGHYKLEIENGLIISLVDLRSDNRQVLSYGSKAN